MVEEAHLEALRQQGSGVRVDWGPSAAGYLEAGQGALVVVDTLSFTTAVSVATGRGTAVHPWPLADEGAASLAASLGAALAVPRRMVSPEHPWSLSPQSLLDAPFAERLVLPSPNGSAVAAAFVARSARSVEGSSSRGTSDSSGSSRRARVLAGCLRNAAATARWLCANGYGTPDRPVTVLAAGERWPDGTLRPAIEDLLGAGAIVEHLRHATARAGAACSVEAAVAASVFADLAGRGLPAVLEACASGRELAAMGFPGEAAVAAALDADGHASVLDDGAFVAA